VGPEFKKKKKEEGGRKGRREGVRERGNDVS
jgi:hypothetical protein